MSTRQKSKTIVPVTLNAIAERARELAAEAERLEAQLKQTRGTREIPTKATIPAKATIHNSTDLLLEHMVRLLKDRPLRFRDLMSELGAEMNENRVKGVLVRLQRDGHDLVNLGDGARAVWFIPDADVLKRLRGRGK